MALTEVQIERRQILLGLMVGLGCWLALGAVYWVGGFEVFDHHLLDWRFRLRGERDASSTIALVSIDDATIRAYGGWPLPRDQYALLLDILARWHAKAIGVDLQLPEDINHKEINNALLASVSGLYPNIVHSAYFMPSLDPNVRAPDIPRASSEALQRQGIPDVIADVPTAAGAFLPYATLMGEATALGHINVTTDRDGAIRRQPFLIRYEDRVYPSMTMRMIGIGTGHRGLPRVEAAPGGVRVGWGPGASWRLPLDREGSTSLDFAGDRRAFSNAHSMIAILRAVQTGDTMKLRESFAGRYVLVGLDSQTEVSDDVGTTPFSEATSLVFVHANAVENLLQNRFLTQPPLGVYLICLLAVALFIGWLSATLPMAGAAVVMGGTVLGIAAIDFALFALMAIDVPPFAALFIPPLVYGAVTSGRYLLLESRSRDREADIREGRSVEQRFLPEAMIGHLLGRYRVEEKLGRGGMGVVYRAHDPRIHRDVAIKVLPGLALADENARRRFRREARALSKLNHRNIAEILDFDTQVGVDFLVMEFIRGTPLTGRIKRGALTESEVLRIAGKVTEALVEAHRRGVVHRDLKPENIMLTDRGEVKVLDFGLALFLEASSDGATRSASITEEGHFVGTLPYMAPEVLRGATAEARSDLYSLGVVVFEMATGRRPFPDDESHELLYTILHQAPPQPRILNGRISERMEALILRLLAKDPEERYASATELAQALHAVPSGTPAGDPARSNVS